MHLNRARETHPARAGPASFAFYCIHRYRHAGHLGEHGSDFRRQVRKHLVEAAARTTVTDR